MTTTTTTTTKKYYVIKDREAGNKIDEFDTLEQAEKALSEYEMEDKNNDVYVPDFYEIVEKAMEYQLVDRGSSTVRYNFKNVIGTFDTLEEALSHAAYLVEEAKYDDETGEELGYSYGEGTRNKYDVEEVNEDGELQQGWEVNGNGETYVLEYFFDASNSSRASC